jgi:flagellar hook-associated protein 1 FlgK
MPGLFQGLEIGKQALLGHQVRMQTMGHNISNASTPGYTRQRVNITTAYPEVTTYGTIGGGMKVTSVRQVKDLFLGQQYREAQKDQGHWTYLNKTFTQIESIFSEPQDGSLNEVLDNFWNDWSALSSDAENSGNRSSLLANAGQVINSFAELATSLTDLQQATDRDLTAMTAEVNSVSDEIARLNKQIVATELDGTTANDLRDRRDLLLDQVATLIDVNTHEDANGSVRVFMGSMLLVDGPDSFGIGAVAERDGAQITHRLVWEGTDYELTNANGQLAGLLETRDEVIPRYLEELNRLSRTIVEEVNALHMSGYGLDGTTGVAFFDPNYTDANELRLNQQIVQDKNLIAASGSSNPDDRSNGDIAARLADLRNAQILSSNSATINEFYVSLVASLGVEAREADSFESNYGLISQQIDNQRQSVQGVSLDEEMADLVAAQHAFEAASRLITVMDEALDTVIFRMGIVGS